MANEFSKIDFLDHINLLKKKSSTTAMKGLVKGLSPQLQRSVDENFRQEGYFEQTGFKHWNELSPVTKEIRMKGIKGRQWHGEGQSMLKDTYRLWAEVKKNVRPSYKMDEYSIALKTHDKNALRHARGFWHTHIFGKKKTPRFIRPRPFYSFSPYIIGIIKGLVERYFFF